MAFFLASLSSVSLFSRSFSSARRFLSFSRIARSYSLSSSVRLGARTPSAPAIIRPATAVVFSGLLSSPPTPDPAPLSPLSRPAPYGELSGKSKGVGDAGVGGGGCGGSSTSVVAVDVADSGAAVSVSVSEPDDSRSQLSATGLDLGLCNGFCGTVVESFSVESVSAISAVGEWCHGWVWSRWIKYLFGWAFCGRNLRLTWLEDVRWWC
jgi:hypothetical protein